MEKFLHFIKYTKKKIDNIDNVFKPDYKNLSNNPFCQNKNKTYIWIEKVKEK